MSFGCPSVGLKKRIKKGGRLKKKRMKKGGI